MRKVFKSFDKIGVEQRQRVIISLTTKGLKVETFSAYTDEKEYIYYMTETEDFNRNTDWAANWNETTKYWQALEYHITGGGITPYRTIVK